MISCWHLYCFWIHTHLVVSADPSNRVTHQQPYIIYQYIEPRIRLYHYIFMYIITWYWILSDIIKKYQVEYYCTQILYISYPFAVFGNLSILTVFYQSKRYTMPPCTDNPYNSPFYKSYFVLSASNVHFFIKCWLEKC